MNIKLDESTHIYTVDGEVKQSVTQTLRGVGILDGYNSIPEYYADRGTRTHAACELLAQGWIEWDKVDDDIIEFVRTFDRLMFGLGLEYVSSEQLCYDEEFNICGKYDLIMMYNGKRTLAEIKTGALPMWVGLQCAAYERMTGVEDVLAISLKDGGKVYGKGKDFNKNHEAWRDINVGFFEVADWKKDRKRRHMERIL